MTPSRMVSELLAHGRALLQGEARPVPARVPALRWAGRCRCGGMVPARLLRRIEQECEFYRRVM